MVSAVEHMKEAAPTV